LRAVLGDFPDTKHQELPGAWSACSRGLRESRRSNSANVKLSDEQALQKVKGVATVFVCKKCSPEDESYDSWPYYTPPPRQPTQLLFYPHVLTHSCLTRQGTGLLEDYEIFHDPSRSLGSYGLQERTRWQARVAVDTYASGIAEAVIRYIGLDPATATSDDVDHLDDRFICRSCSKKSPIQDDMVNGSEHCLYDWRSLVRFLCSVREPQKAEFSIILGCPSRVLFSQYNSLRLGKEPAPLQAQSTK